ncbi:endoprotease bli-like [Mercenaria mercenaria]|uniref:endoprotease bli-like n=1 Tax=Mercenaria mercenaria TaxID=6596 RepID=UPI00234EB210|nr:endoprotease bli-like [Mercenaria mercenaria]
MTLRDVQHLLVQASEPVGKPGNNNFTLNGAGRYFHSVFGYGLLNAGRLVTLAENRQPVAPLLTEEEKPIDIRYPTPFTQEVDFCYSCVVNNSSKCVSKLEHVTINISFQTACGKLQIVLASPDGTESVLVDLPNVSENSRYTIHLMSVQFWDEVAFGTYMLKIIGGSNKCGRTKVLSVSLILYGTNDHKAKERQCRVAKKHASNDKRVHSDTEYALIFLGGGAVVLTALMVYAYRINASRIFIIKYWTRLQRFACKRLPPSDKYELHPFRNNIGCSDLVGTRLIDSPEVQGSNPGPST